MTAVPTFYPPAWARGPHLQTILAHLWPVRGLDLAQDEQAERWEVELPDGDRLVCFHRVPAGAARGATVYMFHGMTGDTSADYVAGPARALVEAGYGVVAVNHRGCGAGRGLARGPYHAGRAEDVSAVIAEGRARLGDGLAHIAVGYSLSGNCLLLLGARPQLTRPDASIAVNPPVDLRHCVEAMDSGINRLYQRRFMIRLTRALRERELDGMIEPGRYRIRSNMSLRDFDEEYTAPAGGFDGAEGYYRDCSSARHLASIEVPTLLITSRDDPFIDFAMLEGARRSEAVELCAFDHGGHLGYLARKSPQWEGRRWLDRAIVSAVERVQRTRLGLTSSSGV